MGYIRMEQDSDGIIELIFDQPGKSVNTMGNEYDEAMQQAIVELQQRVEAGGVTGIYVRSGKPGQFFDGGDIKEMLEMELEKTVEVKTAMFENILRSKAPMHTLEPTGIPYV